MYKVLSYFTDLQDKHHPYNEGDIFPRDGLKVSEARLKELSSTNNKRGIKLIELMEEQQETKDEIKYTKTEINRMSVTELKAVASKNGIEGADEITGNELKKLLIEKFGL